MEAIAQLRCMHSHWWTRYKNYSDHFRQVGAKQIRNRNFQPLIWICRSSQKNSNLNICYSLLQFQSSEIDVMISFSGKDPVLWLSIWFKFYLIRVNHCCKCQWVVIQIEIMELKSNLIYSSWSPCEALSRRGHSRKSLREYWG